jgi:hypothetical protein
MIVYAANVKCGQGKASKYNDGWWYCMYRNEKGMYNRRLVFVKVGYVEEK